MHPQLTVLAAENVIVPKIGEVVIGLLAFAILCFVLMEKVFPRLEATFQQRREAIEGGIRRAEEEQARAHAAYEKYTKQLADGQQEAARYREEARADAQRIRAEAQEQAQADAHRVQQAAEERLAAERAGLVADLRREIGGLATELAARIVGHQLQADAAQQRLVDEFIAGLEDENAGQPTPVAVGRA